tara:strand:+ start:301 stop:720 length:420 start_codon:yes stop_codon:yes gene_type:complete
MAIKGRLVGPNNEFVPYDQILEDLGVKKETKSYMIDIDGTICSLELFMTEDGKVDNDETKALPYKERINHFNDLYDEGNEIHYWTARGTSTGSYEEKLKLTENQLIDWGVKYTSVKVGKPHYDVWIDDKAQNVDAYFND